MRYKVNVKFNKDYVKVSGTVIEMGIMSRPVEGKANREIIKKLSKHFNVSSSSVKILSGKTSKNKVIDALKIKLLMISKTKH